jgi:acyl carrier protein
MNRDEAFEIIEKIIHTEIPEATVELDSKLIDDLGFDSMDIVQLCVDLEEELDIEINDDGFKFKTVTVGNIVGLVVQAKI